MLVTVYTDASYNHTNHTSGWAVWAESERGRLVRYGSCPDSVSCSNHAELYAIYMAVSLSFEEWGEDIHAFKVVSDSECALRHVRKGPLKARTRDREMLKLREMVQDVFRQCGVQVLTEHVKSHQDPATSHEAIMNNRVDKMAAKGRRAQRGHGYLSPETETK